jgi:hypothetical protein
MLLDLERRDGGLRQRLARLRYRDIDRQPREEPLLIEERE